jgi:hypothetical protein
MSMPGFSADASLYDGTTSHISGNARRRFAGPRAGAVVPAIPFCDNCDEILDRCSRNGWRPRAVCNACAVGNCFSGVENPIPPPGGWPRGLLG